LKINPLVFKLKEDFLRRHRFRVACASAEASAARGQLSKGLPGTLNRKNRLSCLPLKNLNFIFNGLENVKYFI